MSLKHIFIIIAGGIAATFFTVGSNLYGSELKFPSRGGGETIVINLADRDEVRWMLMPLRNEFIAPLAPGTELEADNLCAAQIGSHTWAVGYLQDRSAYCSNKPAALKEFIQTDPMQSIAICSIMFNMRFAGWDGLKLICTAEDEKPTAGAGHVNSGILRRM